MNCIARKTFELGGKEFRDINNLLCEVFHFEYTPEILKALYTSSSLGYSFHSLLYDDNVLVGYEAYIPFYYLKNEEKFLAVLGINTVTAPTHRDFFNYYDVYNNGIKILKENDVKLRFGFPNDNSCPLLIKGFKHKLIGHLDTFVTPIKIGGFKKSLRFLNPLSNLFSWFLTGLSIFSHDTTEEKYAYRKELDSFNSIRYKWYNGGYNFIKEEDYYFVYKNKDYEGTEAAFLLDVQPLCPKNFNKAIRYIYKHEKKNVDVILYVGSIDFLPLSMVKIPRNVAPKNFNFTCRILDKEYFDDSVLDIRNWEVNLSNYDLV